MKKELALKLLNDKLINKNTIKHSLAVEAVMRTLANHFGEDEEVWGMAGLLHDLDYESIGYDWDKHGLVTEEWLKEYELPKEVFDLIKAHNADANGYQLKSRGEIAIYASDPVTGLIIAAALMNPEKKIKNVELKSLTKKFKNLKFAAGANREHIRKCEENNLSVEEFLNISLKAMQTIDKELGL